MTNEIRQETLEQYTAQAQSEVNAYLVAAGYSVPLNYDYDSIKHAVKTIVQAKVNVYNETEYDKDKLALTYSFLNEIREGTVVFAGDSKRESK